GQKAYPSSQMFPFERFSLWRIFGIPAAAVPLPSDPGRRRLPSRDGNSQDNLSAGLLSEYQKRRAPGFSQLLPALADGSAYPTETAGSSRQGPAYTAPGHNDRSFLLEKQERPVRD